MMVRKFEYLVALAREGHFARAAAACNVSQPTLSTALRQLESEMGATIVKRGQRYSGLTAQGERILSFARRVLSDFENLRQELENQGSESLGTLRVGVIPSASAVAASYLAPFQKQHPQIQLNLIELTPASIQRAFDDFTVDVAITYAESDARSQQRVHPLYVEEYALLASRGSITRSKSISWEEASRFSLCLMTQEMLSGNSGVRAQLRKADSPSSQLETNSVTALCAYVRTGEWCAILPRALAAYLQEAEDMECFALPAAPNAAQVGVVIPDREFAVPLAEAFFAFIMRTKSGGSKKRQNGRP